MGSGASSLQEFDALPAAEREAAFEAIQLERDITQFDITVAGHVRDECNGLYRIAGEENGKPKWAKAGVKLFWHGSAWDICWGGVSPENKKHDRYPAKDGWDGQGQPENTIRLTYTKRPVPSAPGTWTKHENIDMCGQGDVDAIGDWKESKTIDELKAIVEARNLSAFTVSEHDFGHAALKNFDYPLTPEHCKPAEGYSCTIYIYTPPPELAKLGEAPRPEEPEEPEYPDGSERNFHSSRVEVAFDPCAQRLRLVNKGSKSQCVFEHRKQLAAGEEFVPLTLASGKALVFMNQYEKQFMHYHLLTPAVGKTDVAVRARLDKDGFLTCEGNGFVLDVQHWHYEADNKLWILREHDDPTREETRNGGGGRSFKINDDGTISPTHAEHLVLGTREAAEFDISDAHIPPDFPLPTNGSKFRIASPFDEERQMEIFAHEVNCPVVFSHCSLEYASWYVSAMRADGAFRLSVQRPSGILNMRLDIPSEGEVPKVVRSEGSWFLAEMQHGNRFRLKVPKEDCLGKEEVQNVRDQFNAIDTNKSGFIDAKELAHKMKAMNARLSDEDVQAAFKKMDVDGNGKVEFWEYLKMVKTTARAGSSDSFVYLGVGDDDKGWNPCVAFDEPRDANLLLVFPIGDGGDGGDQSDKEG